MSGRRKDFVLDPGCRERLLTMMSMRRILTLLPLGLLAVQTPFVTPESRVLAASPSASESSGSTSLDIAAVPMVFEPNLGQAAPGTAYVARGASYTVRIAPGEATLRLAGRATPADVEGDAIAVGLRWLDAGSAKSVAGEDRRVGHSNYFIGNHPDRWLTGVPHYGVVRQRDLYPGIDLVYRGNGQHLQYDFEVAAGADPAAIAVAITGVDDVALEDASGDLLLRTGDTVLRQQRPVSYQVVDGVRRDVSSRYRLDGHVARIDVGLYDTTRPLVIDPTILFSTYLGGNSGEYGVTSTIAGISVDATGVYLSGDTSSSDFPEATGGLGGIGDGFITKLTTTGNDILFSTYLGGTGVEDRVELVQDPAGNVYVSGRTTSGDLPATVGAFQAAYQGGPSDAFFGRLNQSTGAIVYLSYLGGDLRDTASSIFALSPDNVFVTGTTASTAAVDSFPVSPGAFQAEKATGVGTNGANGPLDFDAFVGRFDLNGGGLADRTYLTYLGGNSAFDGAFSVVADATFNAYVAGNTPSSNWPVLNALQSARAGADDIFVTKLNPTGTGLVFSTYLGGTGAGTVVCGGTFPCDESAVMTISSFGDLFLAGWTRSTNFPQAPGNPPPFAPAGGQDALAVKITGDGSQILYSATLGGSGNDIATAVAIDIFNIPYLAGATFSGNFPTTASAAPGLKQNPGGLSGATDAFIAKFNGDASVLAFSGLLGGTGQDIVLDMTLDSDRNTYVIGQTGSSTGFPLLGAVDSTFGGLSEAFVTKLGPDNSAGTGPDDDSDNDGTSNDDEVDQGTDPSSAFVRFFAEGVISNPVLPTDVNFDTQFAIFNPNALSTSAVVRYQTDFQGTIEQLFSTIGAQTRVTANPETDTMLTDVAFATEIRSSRSIVADRTVRWGTAINPNYGSHGERSIAAPASTWFLAEGATGIFNLFYLVLNPNPVPANVGIRYLRRVGAPVDKNYVVAANSRRTIWVNTEGSGLDQAELSAVITTSALTPVLVERAMYLNNGGIPFNAGHESAALLAPQTTWSFAEGATGPFFDLFILLANNSLAQAANVQATFLLPNGSTIVRNYQVAANSRFNIWVDTEGGALADTAVSTTLVSDIPILAERAMWWTGTSAQWYEGHNSAGASSTATTWAIAEGEVNGPFNLQTYVLIANTAAQAGDVRVTVFPESGAPQQQTFTVNGNSRFNVPVRDLFSLPGPTRFSTLVESLDGRPLIVETAIYNDAGGVFWAGGSNLLGTPVEAAAPPP